MIYLPKALQVKYLQLETDLSYINLGETLFATVREPNGQIITHGLLSFPMLATDLIVFVNKKFKFWFRWLALSALFFFTCLNLNTSFHFWHNRYYGAFFMMSSIPLAVFLEAYANSRFVKRALLCYAIVSSFTTVLFNCEKRPFAIRFNVLGQVYHYESAFKKITDRNELLFSGWGGWVGIYRFMKDNILPSDSLLIVNLQNYKNKTYGEVPFNYPFIMDRDRANTRFIGKDLNFDGQDRIQQEDYLPLIGRYDFIMVMGEKISTSQYILVFEYPQPYTCNIYKKR